MDTDLKTDASTDGAASAAEDTGRTTKRAPSGFEHAIVRRGTIMVGDHGSEKPVGPGGRVTLPSEDVAELRARGILHDPDQAPAVPNGPRVELDTVGDPDKAPGPATGRGRRGR
jgi:hypothetical protein